MISFFGLLSYLYSGVDLKCIMLHDYYSYNGLLHLPKNKPGNLYVNMAHPLRTESYQPEWMNRMNRNTGNSSKRDGGITGAAQKGIVFSGRGEKEREIEGEWEAIWRSGGSGLDVWNARGCFFGSLITARGNPIVDQMWHRKVVNPIIWQLLKKWYA